MLAIDFKKSNTIITLGLTISLIPRFIGAATFGLAADRFGRKWPFIVNCALLIILEMALGFCKTYTPFIICRTLFGVAMGGLYGNATSTALEDCPERARGLVSGIFQSGYSMGWLLALAFTKVLVKGSSIGTFEYSLHNHSLRDVWIPSHMIAKSPEKRNTNADPARSMAATFLVRCRAPSSLDLIPIVPAGDSCLPNAQ
jgi:MFS family permease